MRLSSTRVFLFALCAVLSTGCDACIDFFDGGDDVPPVTNAGVGDACTGNGNCRLGLVCRTGFCTPAGTTAEGALCRLSGECAPGLYCGGRRVCETAGTAAEDESCESTSDCTQGLVCALTGFSTRCRATGTADLGDACMGLDSCLAGLTCTESSGRSSCVSAPPVAGISDGGVPPLPTLPFWAGETCAGDVPEVRAYFDVPRGVATDGDFYRLPYPNDARRTSAGLDLTGHPHPGTALSIDVIDRYLRAGEADLRGFSTNPTLYFRFSRPYDWASLDGALELVDITVGSPTYGQPSGIAWLTTGGMITRYICPNWIGLRTPHGAPLRPGTTYAALISNSVRPDAASGGGTFARAPDFDAVLSATAPADATLANAYAKYAPLRAYLTDTARDPASLLTASVFTTQPVEDVVPRLRAVIRAASAPTLSDATVCDTGVTSPCDDGTPQRACVTESASFVEVHGRIALPIFQSGTAPYEDPDDGGGIERDAAGAPSIARTENVCFALTIPKEPMPAGGWPLMLYAHGTGGSFRGAATDLAAEMSTPTATVRAATLAIDLPEHGARRGASTRSPQELFYNFANPRAARDNVVQGAADLYSLVYFATTYSADAATSPTGEALSFDPTRIVLFAHSQGATHASLMLPWEPDLAAVLLSGDGGDLTQSLLTKTNPVNIARVLPLALLDVDGLGNLSGGEWHPVLGLFQQYFDSVDPVNYARRFATEPPMGDTGRHLFMTYGPGDTYSTEATMQSLAHAARFPIVRPVLVDFGLAQVDAPLTGNAVVGAAMRTQGLRQYAPEGAEDGHFVSTRTTAGRADTLRFMRGALAGETPVIGP